MLDSFLGNFIQAFKNRLFVFKLCRKLQLPRLLSHFFRYYFSMSKKKKFTKLNQTIRHYFGEDGFDAGIERVDEATLIELALTLGLAPESYSKKSLVRIYRTLWSEADIELRRHIVEFFRAEGKIYLPARPNADRHERSERIERIDELLDELDITDEERIALHNAFSEVRARKINLYKLQSKLELIRFEQKKERIEREAQGHFDIEDRFEFNASLEYRIHGEAFRKIQPLRTRVFPFNFLQEAPSEQILTELTEAKTALTATKQEELTAFLQAIAIPHPYLSDEEIVAAIKRAQPSENVTLIALRDEIMARIISKSLPLSALSQTITEIILTVSAEFQPPQTERVIPYELHLLLPKQETLQTIWRGGALNLSEMLATEKKAHEEHFVQEYEALVASAKESASALQLKDEDVVNTILEFLIPHIHGDLLISRKAAKRVLSHFNDSIRDALLKHQRQQLLARTIRDFKNLFPLARELRRKLVLHIGPTNSGKTYQAMKALERADTGYYLAPLRLLALEGYEELKKAGVASSLITGEEQLLDEDATHISSTIEMLNFETDVDVCVIDEVQMIDDRDRGWAWANGIIGAPAKTVIMTGSSNVREAVIALAEYLNEPLEIIEFERKNPLELLSHATPINEIKPATAVIAFSRANVLRLKQQLSRNYRVSVVYGNLSPEVRREEARRFREGETEILVATDAIAMGLNLPIKTVLFSRGDKFDGENQRLLLPSEIHQIAGRAGRYGLHEKGYVGSLRPEVLEHLKKTFHEQPPMIKIPFNVMANLEHIKLVGGILEENSLAEILRFFVKNMKFNGPFRAANLEDMLEAAQMVDRYDLDLPTKFHLACAPLTLRSPFIIAAYERYLRSLEQGRPIAYIPPGNLGSHAQSMDELLEAEDYVKEISLYLWLSYRFADYFIDTERAKQNRVTLNNFIENSLKQSHFVPRCRQCTKALPLDSKFQICQSCFKKLNMEKRREERESGATSRPKRRH
jgi:ATP-dependent RNA helicase SUPV3L1/SUV3